MTKSICVTIMSVVLLCFSTYAQDLKVPVDYLHHISEAYSGISKEQWDYTKAIGHGKRDKVIEKRRVDLLKSIQEARRSVAKMPSINKSTALRDTVLEYFRVSYSVVNEDYGKIIDMEAVAEQSYDLMEAYILAKSMADEKLTKASEMVSDQVDRFAVENNIKLVEADTKLGKKMRAASKVFDYYNAVYLLFFKASIQHTYMIDAQNKEDINALEQSRNGLIKYSQESLENLKKYPRYAGDETMANACRSILQFYVDKAQNKMPVVLEYYTAKDKFDKIKKSFDLIKPADRTKQNVDTYNAAVKEINVALTKYNDNNKMMNESSSKALEQWNKKSGEFLDSHVP